ncbi:BTAD domain-containing putative transcriptional regulator [Streptomyces sp. NPDC093600]|uniref:AfsR/SARP family transcriptional regulator n=1 Tax=Streptomyces sp. NPDC093600 TaxID=3366047 RepID=UPI00380C49CB
MDLKVLGVFAVKESGTPIVPVTAPARRMLALLTAFADQVVPTAVVVQELWPDGPPAHALDMVETYVRQVRELIDTALRAGREEPGSDSRPVARSARDVLVSLPGGYRLDTGGGSSDVSAFHRAVGAGYRAMELEDLETAAERLGQALALWTADAYTEVAAGPQLRAHITRLEQSRVQALDQWIEAQLRLGRRRELYAALPGFLARFSGPQPTYEGLLAELEHGADPVHVLEDCERLLRCTRREPAAGRVRTLLRTARPAGIERPRPARTTLAIGGVGVGVGVGG